jgi:hypothetical protein
MLTKEKIDMNTYWFQKIQLLLDINKSDQFYPKSGMTYARKVNALVRGSIYLGVILSLIKTNYLFLYIPVTVMILTYVNHLFRVKKLDHQIKKHGEDSTIIDLPPKIKEAFSNVIQTKPCAEITQNNPFMNPLVFDKRTRNAASNVLQKNSQYKIDNAFSQNTYRDASDIFNRNNGQRQFVTVPSTTYPNNQGLFANWLYGTPTTCKEGNGAQCVANLHHPLQRRLFAPGHGSSTN